MITIADLIMGGFVHGRGLHCGWSLGASIGGCCNRGLSYQQKVAQVTLSDLKPRGYKLSDVEPGFQGMPYFEWWGKMIASQCDAFRESPKAKV